MPSVHFKQRQKQHLLTALRESPKPIPGLEMIQLAAVVRRCVAQGMPMPVAEAAPEGGMIVPEEDTLSVTLDMGGAGHLRYSIQGLAIPNMPIPIKLHTA